MTDPTPEQWRLSTRLVRGGLARTSFSETSEALFLNSGYVYQSAEEAEASFDGSHERYVYSRFRNPTVSMFEDRLALAEGAEACRAMASGMAAVNAAIFSQVQAGDRVVATRAKVHSDLRLLTHILQNLIGNALKYTERGGVLVGARRRGNTVAIEVHDSGIGIPEDQLGSIFEEFHRLDVQRAEGFGLGLAIVKRMADLLGHRLSVQSVPAKGTRFAVELPLAED